MKIRNLALLVLALTLFVGCQKENKPYSFYQIGASVAPIEDIESEQYKANDAVLKYLISNGYILTSSVGRPLIIEGDVEANNDRQAKEVYNSYYQRLKADQDNLNKAIKEWPNVTVTFQYQMTKGQSAPGLLPDCNNLFTVTANPPQ